MLISQSSPNTSQTSSDLVADVPEAKDVLVGEVSRFIAEAIQHFEPDLQEKTRGRPRILPSLCLWGAMLICIVHGFSSQLALWRMIRTHGVSTYPPVHISDQAIYKRLQTEGEVPLQRLFAFIQGLLQQRLAPLLDAQKTTEEQPETTGERSETVKNRALAPFATEVISFDEMTLDQVKATIPELREVPKGDDQRILGKIAALFDVRLQQWRKIEFVEDFRQNGKVIARDLVTGLAPGTLLLCDLGYFAFEWFDWLTQNQFFYISRLKNKVSYKLRHTLYSDATGLLDAIVWLGVYSNNKAAHAVRLVRIPYQGNTYIYITNVLDPQLLSVADIAQLYARRWDIESAFRLVKQYLNLHLLWSAKEVVVKQQLWATLIVASILQALRWEIALRAEVDIFDVSMALMVQYLPGYFARAKDGSDPIAAFIADGRAVGFIRPSRRRKHQVPEIDPKLYLPIPPDLTLIREPKCAHKK